MEYVDLVLLHQALGDYFAAYRGITKAYKEGLTKAVGVSNFYPFVLANFCENVEVIPAVNQVEFHPFFRRRGDLLRRANMESLPTLSLLLSARNTERVLRR